MISDWTLSRYDGASDSRMWNEFVARSRNATFLLDRGYMDYHSDRFRDYSIVARLRGNVAALLPAHVTDDGVLHSHSGLTYGGWMLPQRGVGGYDVVDLFDAWLPWLRARGVKAVDYKPLPHIYHKLPSNDDLYALFLHDARLTERCVSSTIDLVDGPGPDRMQRRHLRAALEVGPVIGESEDYDAFHALLSDCLAERHDTTPVHTAGELRLLHDRFPDKIRLFTARVDGRLEAGIIMYMTDTVAHAQYSATTPFARLHHLQTPLYRHIMDDICRGYRWFDFGICTEEGGRVLNRELLRYKTSFGATDTIYERYLLNV